MSIGIGQLSGFMLVPDAIVIRYIPAWFVSMPCFIPGIFIPCPLICEWSIWEWSIFCKVCLGS